MYYDYNGNEIEDLEMDNMRRDSRDEQRQGKLTIIFDEARAFLYIADNFGGNIDLNPKQAMELLDFLLQNAKDIRGYITPEDAAQSMLDKYQQEQGMQDFEEAMWKKWQEDSVDPRAREF
jgi:hypothetical protein